MSGIKSQTEWKRVFVGAVMLLGGGVCILVPATTLKDRSLIITIVLGITQVILGTSFIWSASESLRERKREREKHETKIT